MGQIRSYSKIYNLGHRELEGFLDDEVLVEEKLDGCFSAQTLVHLADGSKAPIRDLVKNRYDKKVICYDFENKEYTTGRVLNWFEYPSSHKDMVTVRLMGRNESSRNSFQCTVDHKIFTKGRGWVEAQDLMPTDEVQMINENLSFMQEQMIIGTLLGDANLSKMDVGNPRYVNGHTIKKKQYNQLISKLLGGLFARFDVRMGGFEGSGEVQRVHSKSSYLFNEAYDNFYGDKKIINYDFLRKKLTPVSLAFWYMDDGSIGAPDGQRPRPKFFTNGFSYNCCLNLVKLLNDLFNIETTITESKGFYLNVCASSQEKFFSLVSPYMSEDMLYKIPEEYQTKTVWTDNLFNNIAKPSEYYSPVKGVEPCKAKMQYDIETEYHNYLVSSTGVLVHNSQFSFQKIDGKLFARSKGQELDIDGPEKMFSKGVNTVKAIEGLLHEGWTYRAEYLQKPKHNTLAYDRTPHLHLIIFDIDKGDQNYLSYDEKKAEADRLGLEVVPAHFKGKLNSFEDLKDTLDQVSCLGGQKIEGVVIKNYNRYGGDKKTLMAKYVSEAFKELHRKDWTIRNPGGKDIKGTLVDSLRTEARWHKVIQHLRDAGQLTDSPKDIGPLMKELNLDIKAECEEYIKDELFKWAWKDVIRGVSKGFPQFYKDELAKKQFGEDDGKTESICDSGVTSEREDVVGEGTTEQTSES